MPAARTSRTLRRRKCREPSVAHRPSAVARDSRVSGARSPPPRGRASLESRQRRRAGRSRRPPPSPQTAPRLSRWLRRGHRSRPRRRRIERGVRQRRRSGVGRRGRRSPRPARKDLLLRPANAPPWLRLSTGASHCRNRSRRRQGDAHGLVRERFGCSGGGRASASICSLSRCSSTQPRCRRSIAGAVA